MTPQSRKAKGRKLQQKVVATLRAFFSWPEADAKSLPMGAQGADVWLSSAAFHDFPFHIECKNVEKLNVWQAWEQAKSHAEGSEAGWPLLIFSRNNSEILATLRFEDLLTWRDRP